MFIGSHSISALLSSNLPWVTTRGSSVLASGVLACSFSLFTLQILEAHVVLQSVGWSFFFSIKNYYLLHFANEFIDDL